MEVLKNNSKKMIETLLAAARAEKWDEVDRAVKTEKVKKDQAIAEWALDGLVNDEENVRDLAATILEHTYIPFAKLDSPREILVGLLENYPPGYDGFRAACALASHGAGDYGAKVRSVLEKATKDKDEDVKRIAGEYLTTLS